jgi:hypothetical protein
MLPDTWHRVLRENNWATYEVLKMLTRTERYLRPENYVHCDAWLGFEEIFWLFLYVFKHDLTLPQCSPVRQAGRSTMVGSAGKGGSNPEMSRWSIDSADKITRSLLNEFGPQSDQSAVLSTKIWVHALGHCSGGMVTCATDIWLAFEMARSKSEPTTLTRHWPHSAWWRMWWKTIIHIGGGAKVC